MSGHKRTFTRVEQSRLNELRSKEVKLRRVEGMNTEQVARRVSQQVREWAEPIAARQRSLDEALRSVSDELRDHQTAVSEAITSQARSMVEGFSRIAGDLDQMETKLRSEMENRQRELERRIEAETQQLGSRIDAVSQRVDALQARDMRARSLAEDLITAGEALSKHIRAELRPENHAPGRLSELEQLIAAAKRTLQSDANQAALSNAQNGYVRLSHLRSELEVKERERLHWRGVALHKLTELEGLLEANRTCEAIDWDGNVLQTTEPLDVDFLTEGVMGALEEQLQVWRGKIESQVEPLSRRELQEFVEEEASALRDQITDAVREARVQALASEERACTADAVIEVLKREGFVLSDEAWEDGDPRLAYVAKLVHIDGGEVVVTVAPDDRATASSAVDIHSYDYELVSQEVLDSRRESLQRALGQQHEVPSVQSLGEPQEDYRDIQRVKTGQVRVTTVGSEMA